MGPYITHRRLHRCGSFVASATSCDGESVIHSLQQAAAAIRTSIAAVPGRAPVVSVRCPYFGYRRARSGVIIVVPYDPGRTVERL
jgi:hypothetical protein